MKKTAETTGSRNAQAALRGANRHKGHPTTLGDVVARFLLAILALACFWAFWRTTTGGHSPQPIPSVVAAVIMPTPTTKIIPSGGGTGAGTAVQPTVTPEPIRRGEATATPVGQWALEVAPPPWPVDCTDEVAWNGYIVSDFDDYCVPGILSRHTLNIQFPRDFYGVLSSYGPYAMELMEDRAGVRRGHGVALTTCGMMGYTVWLRLPGDPWHGPFTVVDCGAQAHTFYQIAVQGLAVEVGYTVGQTWTPASSRVDVRIGSYPGPDWDGLYLAHWWVDNALQWETGYPLLQHLITRTDGTSYLWPPLE